VRTGDPSPKSSVHVVKQFPVLLSVNVTVSGIYPEVALAESLAHGETALVKILSDAELDPSALVTVRVTVKEPEVEYLWVYTPDGTRSPMLRTVPSPKFSTHVVKGIPEDWSVTVTVRGLQPHVGLAVNFAVGGLCGSTVPVIVIVALDEASTTAPRVKIVKEIRITRSIEGKRGLIAPLSSLNNIKFPILFWDCSRTGRSLPARGNSGFMRARGEIAREGRPIL
jgi:hypothetical protein